MKLNRLTQLTLAGLVFTAGLSFADDFKREGEGARRAALNSMELKPFDATAWSKLSDWTNGGPVSPADTSGRVVVICTWSDWYAPSKRALNQALKLASAHPATDLVVIAVHGALEWDKANKPAQPANGFFRVAKDTNGEFRKAIMADQDPNFYVIDRAGQMRFADLDKSALDAAVASLLKEKTEDAGVINARLAREAAERDAEIRRTAAINTGASMVEIPELPFPPPSADDYKNAKWPKMPKAGDHEQPPDPNNPPAPIAFRLPEAGWLGPKPPNAGRATLVYFWNPDTLISFNEMNVMNRMDLIKTQRSRDLVVAGIVTRLGDQNTDPSKQDDPKKMKERAEKFIAGRDLKQSTFFDPTGGLLEIARRGRSFPIPAPWVAIASSDGVLRWSGWMGLPSFEAALEQVLLVDPGVQARRAVEAEYLRAQGR